MDSRWAGVKSAAALAGTGTTAASAPAIAKTGENRRNIIATMAPADGVGRRLTRSIGIFDLFRLALNLLGAAVGGGVLHQQSLGAAGLLHGVFLPGGREPLLGQRQRRQAHLIVPPIRGCQ